MGSAREIVLKVIPARVANPFVDKTHYSGKHVNNSLLHFGAFLDGRLHGVLSYGPSMDKSKIRGIVRDTAWDGFLELNRMAFDDVLPRNSESYCIARTLRMIKRQAPQVEWVVSFADGCQCGDGTIYRASNFVLTGITKNSTIYETPWGQKIAALTQGANWHDASVRQIYKRLGLPGGKRVLLTRLVKDFGFRKIPGYMFRYVYFLNPKARERLAVPIIPFSEIDKIGAGLYKGEKISRAERHKECEAQRVAREAEGVDG